MIPCGEMSAFPHIEWYLRPEIFFNPGKIFKGNPTGSKRVGFDALLSSVC
jgi:hypothetical protein